METLIANIGRARKTQRHGREYWVAPATLIVPGVLNGSQGPLFYSPEDVGEPSHVDSWNGMPLVVYHPKKDGKPITGRRPDVVDVGRVYNATFDGKLKAEAWFDEDMLRAAGDDGREIINRLEQGQPIELSTGVFTKNDLAAPGSNYNGVTYTHIARHYRPDHLAILPGATGACSLRDGCGVLMNQSGDVSSTSDGEPTMKDQLIQWLTTNCECWKGEKDKEVLNTFDEAKLTQLKKAAEKSKNNEAVANAAKAGFENDNVKIELDPTTNQLKVTTKSVTIPTPPAPPINTPPNPAPNPTPTMSLNEYLKKHGTAEEQAVWNNAVELEQAERFRLANLLVANVADEDAKKAAYAVYVKMPLPTLRPLAAAAEKMQLNSAQQFADPNLPGFIGQPSGLPPRGSYFGAGGAPLPVGNEGQVDRNDVMPTENIDYTEMSAFKNGSV